MCSNFPVAHLLDRISIIHMMYTIPRMAKPRLNSTRLQNFTVFYLAGDEFHHLKREIFTSDCYFFETKNPTPLIVDAGAHIGLSTLYFKYLFPNAQIIAIEPNPVTFEILEKNIFENQLEDVTTINSALFDGNINEIPFFIDETKDQWFSTAGFLKGSWTSDQQTTEIKVPTITLAEVIHQSIDLLKMDIEGAETLVLKSGASVLPFIKQIMVEFHPHENQTPQELISLLEPHFQLKFFQNSKLQPNLKKIRGLFNIHGQNRRSSLK